ncbi:MAG TPA: acyl-CoA synthetase [Methylibium sp.]|uniref:acyl-CoA synthetase n=1 Tax=Methylibium sp. TaxID=2067992 RepID=UPI002DBED512|nr:acyl-CoA synthetase [Methylibium sp.]HEU4459148.1 acyl-CoA synthetase [Methylibium sp.]
MSAVGQTGRLPGQDDADWLRQRERGSALAFRLMAWIALRCGRRFARLVLHPVTLYFVLFSPQQRRHSRRYLGRALGREAGWRDGYRHVHAFASTILDRVYLLRGQEAAFELRTHGTELLDAMLEAGRGAFLVGAHLGSFEALRIVGRARPERRIAMVMYPDNARLIQQTLAAIAPGTEPEVIALGRRDSMLAIRDWLDANGLAGMLADRTLGAPTPGSTDPMAALGAREGTVTLDFIGRPAPFADGPFRLAALLRRRVVFMAGLYLGGARYEVRFEPLADFSTGFANAAEREAAIRAAIAAYVARLEALCRAHPFNWFNFHDFWKEG